MSTHDFSNSAQVDDDDDGLVFRGYSGTLPLFYESEIKVDKLLGTGSFCMAWTIRQINLQQQEEDEAKEEPKPTTNNNANRNIRKVVLPNQASRKRLADRVNASIQKRDPKLGIYGNSGVVPVDPTAPPRCVVKRLRNDFHAQFEDMSRAAEDLKGELEVLLKVGTGQHPNIIDLYAIGMKEDDDDDDDDGEDDEAKEKDEDATGGGLSFQPTFLIISRIRSTVKQLLTKWREQRGFGVYDALSLDPQATRQLWLERMMLLARLADALRFLHSKRIVFRDVKPENVGVDDNGVVKLFDFGLAKEIDEKDHEQREFFQLTGDTGTPMFMPPEVAMCKPYNYTVDVYALSILMHQILSLKTPFANVPPSDFRKQVFVDGLRPVLEPSWPLRLREMMERMWHPDPAFRPSAEHVATTLSEMLRGSDEELFPVRRWF